MKRVLTTMIAAILGVAAFAYVPGVHNVDIDVLLLDDGTACVTEVWDITADSGTEWYLARENLGDISIYDFKVREGYRTFINTGDWDVDASLKAKTGRCGIVHKRKGVELCWGLGSYGNHLFTVSYKMSHAAKSLEDYDMFHIQLLSDELSSAPRKVKATVRVSGKNLSTDNVKMWGFGFYGNCGIEDGAVVYKSSQALSEGSSVIALIRFDKGIIHPTSARKGTFDKVRKKAFRGSDYKKDRTSWREIVDIFLEIFNQLLAPLIGILIAYLPIRVGRKKIKDILGVKKKSEVSWSREIPYGGDLASTDYILEALGEKRRGNFIASAMILRMIQKGCLEIRKDEKGKTEISFGNEKALEEFGPSEKILWTFMKSASGEDLILQDKEFSRWSNRHTDEINDWLKAVSAQGEKNITKLGLKSDGKYTAEGQGEARKALGLKKFLKDYTLIKERASQEVALWQDYLVFGAMFGIADKVASELKDINPTMFEATLAYDYLTMRNAIYMSNHLAGSITNAKSMYDAAHMPSAAASGGFGGSTSFGGGRGFSGGGHGGGCR